MEQSGFTVAIDLGSSKIVGLLARKNEKGVISVLASEVVPSDSCVKHGVVYNIDEAAGKVKKIINLLENKAGKKIGKVYVSVAGRSLRAIEHTQTKVLSPDEEITFQDLDEMEQQARQNKPDFFTNYSVIAPEIFVDGVKMATPEDAIGKTGSLIEGRYRLIVGRPNMKSNLIRCITDKNQLEIAGFVVGPIATGTIVLDEEDKEKGCALVDFGAGTSTVSIYKDGLLRHISVVPFGGKTVSKDIQSLGFAEAASETYKIKYGKVGKDKSKSIVQSNSEVDLKELNKVIQLRVEEIVLNVINQIKESGYFDQLEAGIIITGGASQLDGLAGYLAEKSKLSVKRGVVRRLYINNAADLLQNPIYAQCLGLLLFANENCEKKDEVRESLKSQQRYTNVQHNEPAYNQIKKEEPVKPQQVVEPDTPVVEEDDEDDEPKQTKKKHKKEEGRSIRDFFGKFQNLGGTLFGDED